MRPEEVYGALNKELREANIPKTLEESAKAMQALAEAREAEEMIPDDYKALSTTILADSDTMEIVSKEVEEVTYGVDGRIKKFYTGSTTGTLTDSDEGVIRDLKAFGKSEQETTNGYQLIGLPYATGYRDGVDFTCDNGIITVKGTYDSSINHYVYVRNDGKINSSSQNNISLKAGTYTLSSPDIEDGISLLIRTGSASISNSVYKSRKQSTFTLEEDTEVNLSLAYVNLIDVDYAFHVMLNRGSTAHPYEKFSGGIPAPNPEFPEKITSVEEINVTVADADGNIVKTTKITPPFPMNAIGSVKDELSVDEGVWKYNVTKSKLSNYSNVIKSANSDYDRYVVTVGNVMNSAIAQSLCSHMIKKNNISQTNKPYMFGVDGINGGRFIFDYPVGSVGNITVFKQVSEDYVIAYATQEEQTFPISAEDLEWLRNIRTHYSATNIFITDQNGNDISFMFNYPLALEPFVENIKTAMGDDRKFLYNLEDRIVDEEYNTLMAYVDSEFAAALVEL